MAKQIPEKYQQAEKWVFADTEALADELAKLIVAGTKTATCSMLDEDGIPQVGDVFVVVDGRSEPVCAVELTATDVVPFNQVDEKHAFEEGEGDRSLAYWRKEHQRFFESYDLFSPEMTLILMKFKLIETF
jgi:uncharacterized protein YhfF